MTPVATAATEARKCRWWRGHRWSRWEKITVQRYLTYESTESRDETRQERVCLDCGLRQRRYVGD